MRTIPIGRLALLAVLLATGACAREPSRAAGAPSPTAAPSWTPALVDTLARLGAEDQEGRDGMARAAAAGDTATLKRMLVADSARSLWLRGVARERGWPTPDAVGDSAARAAWLILQHTPFYDWQEEMLPVLEPLAERGKLSRGDLATFTDRVLVHRGQPQRYGTQFDLADGRLVPSPIAAPARVDARRAAMGLPPMAEYARLLAELYGVPVAWPPPP